MNLELSEDQMALASALERLCRDWMAVPDGPPTPFVSSPAFEETLAANGFLDVAQEGFGVMGAVLLIEAIARLPFAVELTASALVAPMLGLSGLTRPVAMTTATGVGAVRFLSDGAAVLVDAGDHLRLWRRAQGIAPLTSFLAFPFGRASSDILAVSEPVTGIDMQRFRALTAIGLAAEIVGAMDKALEITIDFVKERQQFGQPIGAFQAVGHRLAECASLLDGARLLTYRAAATEDCVHAAMAIEFARYAGKRLIWETNQLHGAIALTLEYPLHYWNYRLRALHGVVG